MDQEGYPGSLASLGPAAEKFQRLSVQVATTDCSTLLIIFAGDQLHFAGDQQHFAGDQQHFAGDQLQS